VLLLLAAEGLVHGCVDRAWVAIRGKDVAAETIGIRPLRKTARASSRSTARSRYQCERDIEAAALTTLKLPLSHCIFRPMSSSDRTGGGQWRWQWVMNLGIRGAAGAPSGAWRRYNFEESFRCRSAAETAMGDC
jgi:hypothetical protein